MFGLPLAFTAPLVLAALAALPAIWLLLRVTPPQPRRIDFPPLRILADLLPEREVPARTPPWLLILRLLLAALLILAAAGPIWNPGAAGGTGPLLLVLDNGATAAHDWRDRAAHAGERIDEAVRSGRSVALVATADNAGEVSATAPGSALERLRAVKPQPFLPDRAAQLPSLKRFLDATPNAEIVWVTDRVATASDGERTGFASDFAAAAGTRPVTVVSGARAGALAVAGADSTPAHLAVRVIRAEVNSRDGGTLRAVDARGLPLADTSFTFPANATETQARFTLPIELRNAIARVDILAEDSAAAAILFDERGRRRRVGIVSGASADQAQPLLAPTYYLTRALNPYADVREVPGGVADAVSALIEQQVSVLLLADVGTLDRDTLAKVTAFVEKGGMLVRFAGTRMAGGSDDLVPVRLRRGGRNLGGALSWDAPRTFAAFGRESPFFGLDLPADLGIRRQILAEPDGELTRRTWASLQDGTPIVTADKRGDGLVVLYHVTADAAWSNLPLTGLFVEMLRRTVALAGASQPRPAAGEAARDVPTVSPTRVLDGFGQFTSPGADARAVRRDYSDRARREHPPGFYGPPDAAIAVNTLTAGDRIVPLDLGPLAARVQPLIAAETFDIRAPLLALAVLLLAADTLASLWLGGHLARLRSRRVVPAALLLALVLGALALPHEAAAQDRGAGRGDNPALSTRLAYLVTGDSGVDGTSRAGLLGLSQALASRTAMDPGDPVGVDLTRDELAFFPLLYVPVVASRPALSGAAIRKLDTFMKNGGTVIFDTRDAMSVRAGGQATPEALALRRMLQTLDVPELEPVPRDHVLTKTFYLLDAFVGRYATAQTWVEALPPAADGERRPARAGDSVSPLVITGNDLAAAWAVGRNGEALYPTVGSDPRQREMAIRGGVNLVMYTLTGNYKADQVHVPALLERLGQ